MILEVSQTLGCKFVVTLGEKGAAFTNDAGAVEKVAAPRVAAIDTTGAGDAFVGAFAYGLGLGMSMPDAIALGCACASDSVTRKGTQSSYPSKAQASEILSRFA